MLGAIVVVLDAGAREVVATVIVVSGERRC